MNRKLKQRIKQFIQKRYLRARHECFEKQWKKKEIKSPSMLLKCICFKHLISKWKTWSLKLPFFCDTLSSFITNGGKQHRRNNTTASEMITWGANYNVLPFLEYKNFKCGAVGRLHTWFQLVLSWNACLHSTLRAIQVCSQLSGIRGKLCLGNRVHFLERSYTRQGQSNSGSILITHSLICKCI